jgi:AhpD family alkylhydroperoxidase
MSENEAPGRIARILAKRSENQERLKEETPLLFKGFDDLMTAYYAPSALDGKHKELIAIALSISRCCIPCLAVHTKNAVSAGATRAEVIDSAKIGVEFGGGPSFVVVRNNLLQFLDELLPEDR